MANYGVVGINVGSVGRWTRFFLGILVMLIVAQDLFASSHSHSMASYMLIVLSFIGITGVYTLVHALVGDRLKGRSAWWGTFIFVVPVMFALLAPEFDRGLQIGYLFSLPELNHPFQLALFLYVGISFFFQWRAKYGGCEVVAIPNFILRKNYGSYCVPLLPLDVLEKFIVDKIGERRDAKQLAK